MGQQRLGLREGQLERVSQKHLQPLFDFLGFAAWPDEADQPVIGIAQVAHAPVSRVGWVKRRKLLHPTTMLSSLPPLPCSPEAAGTRLQGCIGWVGSSSVSAAVGWEQLCFDKRVEFVQVDIGKDGAYDAALRTPAQRGMVVPVFQVACLKEGFDEPQKATIVDFLS